MSCVQLTGVAHFIFIEMMKSLKIDLDFQKLIPPLAPEEVCTVGAEYPIHRPLSCG